VRLGQNSSANKNNAQRAQVEFLLSTSGWLMIGGMSWDIHMRVTRSFSIVRIVSSTSNLFDMTKVLPRIVLKKRGHAAARVKEGRDNREYVTVSESASTIQTMAQLSGFDGSAWSASARLSYRPCG